jgi:hypothetical protein
MKAALTILFSVSLASFMLATLAITTTNDYCSRSNSVLQTCRGIR